MFRMMGFDRFEEIFIQGTAGRERKGKVEGTVRWPNLRIRVQGIGFKNILSLYILIL